MTPGRRAYALRRARAAAEARMAEVNPPLAAARAAEDDDPIRPGALVAAYEALDAAYEAAAHAWREYYAIKEVKPIAQPWEPRP